MHELPEGLPPEAFEKRARIRDLWPFLRPQRGRMALGVVLAVIGAGTSILQPIAMAQVINVTMTDGVLTSPLLLLAGLLLLDVIVSGLKAWVLLRAGENLVLEVRRRLIERIMFWRLPVFRKHRRGDLLARVGNDAAALRGVLSDGTIESISSILTLVGAIWIMILIDPVLFIASIVIFAIAGAVAAVFLPRITREVERSNTALGALSADLDRALGGFITVVTSGMRHLERERLIDDAQASWRSGCRAAAWEALTTPVLLFGTNLAFFVVFGFGGLRVGAGQLGLAEFISFILYFGILIPPLIVGFSAFTTIQRCLGALRRITEILDEPSEDPQATEFDRHYLPDEGRSAFSVEITGLSFRYAGREDAVLSDIAFRVDPGEIIALLGESGSGKTTLLYLLSGLEAPDSGRILIDGWNLIGSESNEVLDGIAVVQQEAPVFWGTIRDNFSYGVYPPPLSEEIMETVELLGLSPTIDALPEGLDTQIGDHGASLSGGERQRIAIGRALLRRPRLLLLDEPTAQLDQDNERRLVEILRRFAGRTTIILSTHRQTTAECADRAVALPTLLKSP